MLETATWQETDLSFLNYVFQAATEKCSAANNNNNNNKENRFNYVVKFWCDYCKSVGTSRSVIMKIK